jgi:hypothetical protein
MSDDTQQPIVVKRIKKGGGGAHGGAWKIAYADFVTAMMAFFLLMWLLGSTAQGDLEGIGRWHFLNEGAVSVVRYEWHVRSTRWWMNLIAPFARSMFIRNHGVLMRQGAEGLARLLDAPLVSQESIDMMAEA